MKLQINEVWKDKFVVLAVIETTIKTAMHDVYAWRDKHRPELLFAVGDMHGFKAVEITGAL